MALTAKAFVDFLENRGILAPHDIISLREQVAASKSPLHPTFIARRLVQLRYLNPYFAKTLLEEAIAQHRSVSDEPLQLTDEFEDDDATGAPSKIPFDQPGDETDEREEEIDLTNITLPDINEVDLMSDDAVERAMLIPALRRRSRIADKLAAFRWFDIYRLPTWQRALIVLSTITTLVLIVIVILLILNA